VRYGIARPRVEHSERGGIEQSGHRVGRDDTDLPMNVTGIAPETDDHHCNQPAGALLRCARREIGCKPIILVHLADPLQQGTNLMFSRLVTRYRR
jgi:hypothetical protein